MTNVTYKSSPKKIDVAQTAANTTHSYKVEADHPQYKNYNADEITQMRVQIDDFDAIADGDQWIIQLSYDDQNGATLHVISNILEIRTIGEDFKVLGTNGPIVKGARKIANGTWIIEFRDLYIVYDEYWVNFDTVGQDAAETAHIEIFTKPADLMKPIVEQLKSPSAVR